MSQLLQSSQYFQSRSGAHAPSPRRRKNTYIYYLTEPISAMTHCTLVSTLALPAPTHVPSGASFCRASGRRSSSPVASAGSLTPPSSAGIHANNTTRSSAPLSIQADSTTRPTPTRSLTRDSSDILCTAMTCSRHP